MRERRSKLEAKPLREVVVCLLFSPRCPSGDQSLVGGGRVFGAKPHFPHASDRWLGGRQRIVS